MKCPKCGYVLPADSEFCQYCGEKLPAEAEDTDVVTVPIAERPSQTSEQQSSVESPQFFEEESVLPSYKENESANEDIVSNNYQAETATDNNDSTPASNGAPIHDKKKKYCKYCGGLIDSETKKCFSCGKQFFRFPKKTVSTIALIIAFVVLAGLNVYQYFCNDSTVSGLEQQLETSGTTISDLEQQIKTKDSTISRQKTSISNLEDEIDDLQSENLSNLFKIIFYESHAAIVPDDGTKMYHVYGCDDLDTSYFWIYNNEAAEDYGYYPCPHCH